MTLAQIAVILSFLVAFNVPQNTVDKVQIILLDSYQKQVEITIKTATTTTVKSTRSPAPSYCFKPGLSMLDTTGNMRHRCNSYGIQWINYQ